MAGLAFDLYSGLAIDTGAIAAWIRLLDAAAADVVRASSVVAALLETRDRAPRI